MDTKTEAVIHDAVSEMRCRIGQLRNEADRIEKVAADLEMLLPVHLRRLQGARRAA